MPLRAVLQRVALEFDASAGTGTELQGYLRSAQDVLADVLPAGLLAEGHGGLGTATTTPWIGVLDPDISSSPTRGLYLAYLFSATLSTVTLSLQQGAEELSAAVGAAAARGHLADDAALLQSGLSPSSLRGVTEPFTLESTGWRQRGYEAGSIASLTYRTDALPAEPQLLTDLDRFLVLLADAAATRRRYLVGEPGRLHAGGGQNLSHDERDPLAHFKPKDSSDYVTVLAATRQIKGRRHEALVDVYGQHALRRGWWPSTEDHPLDLTLTPGPQLPPSLATRCIVEAKVLRRGNATAAVREAIGQLFTYRKHFVPQSQRASTPSSPCSARTSATCTSVCWTGSWRSRPSGSKGPHGKAATGPISSALLLRPEKAKPIPL